MNHNLSTLTILNDKHFQNHAALLAALVYLTRANIL